MARYPCSCMYFAAKKLGRYQFGDRPTTAMTRDCVRMRRSPAMSSTRPIPTLPLPVRILAVRVVFADAPARRNPVVQPPGQRRIVAGAERQAFAGEIGLAAEHPVAAFDAQRRGAVVESADGEVGGDLVVEDHHASRQARVLVEQRTRAAAPSASFGSGRRD